MDWASSAGTHHYQTINSDGNKIFDSGLQTRFLKPKFPAHNFEEENEKPTDFLKLFANINILIVTGAVWVSTTAMALLEPCLPIWLMETIQPEKWQLGIVFLPDSIGYLIGTNFFAVPALKFGRHWIAMIALFMVSIGCISVSNHILTVSKFQNEFVKSSFLPKFLPCV